MKAVIAQHDLQWKLPLSYGKMVSADNEAAFIKIRKDQAKREKKEDYLSWWDPYSLGVLCSSIFISRCKLPRFSSCQPQNFKRPRNGNNQDGSHMNLL